MNCYKLETSSFEKVRIPVKQYLCNTIFAHIQITRKHIPIPINDYEITVNYKTLDNEFLSHKATIINSKKGIIGLVASYELTDKFGEVYGEIHIKKSGTILNTLQFFVDVKKSNLPEGEKPQVDNLSMLQEIKKLENNVGNINNLQVENSPDLVSAINKINNRTKNVLNAEASLKKNEIDAMLSIFNI